MIRCVHCHEQISRHPLKSDAWYHLHSGLRNCQTSTRATPPEGREEVKDE